MGSFRLVPSHAHEYDASNLSFGVKAQQKTSCVAARLEKGASPQLKHALADVRRDLRKVVGKTARQVLN